MRAVPISRPVPRLECPARRHQSCLTNSLPCRMNGARNVGPLTPSRPMAEQRKDKVAARWPVVVLVAVGLLLAGAAVAYHVVVRKIRAQLVALVQQSIGGDLREADVAWRVPYGVVVRGVRVVAP